MCEYKKKYIYMPQPPFTHYQMMSTGRLRHFPNLSDTTNNVRVADYDPGRRAKRELASSKYVQGDIDRTPFGMLYRKPCVIFASDGHLRSGASAHLLYTMRDDPDSAFICTGKHFVFWLTRKNACITRITRTTFVKYTDG